MIIEVLLLISSNFLLPDSEMGCVENEEFRVHFFNNIDNVESYTLGVANSRGQKISSVEFLESLDSLSVYTDVDIGVVMNYSIEYPNMNIFLSEKRKWLAWYFEHNCENLSWTFRARE
ncbi:hypothetical protein [Phaeocystidibacter luteus]|uniref:Uncharacterized protein n=1 Tax=Phaeocystidibacter luteus TaxID=911197 RepID=A0A6N6RH22_9FLAO|nr:hypothetical protein [Phaeocystidibacter luteus]KAB2810052.1 hypothetical protein F8C67_07395 [Phaeocystidibacter luteus]